MKSVIITATGTDVGKTLVSAAIMAAHPEFRYWKPIQAGTLPSTDSETVQQLTGCGHKRVLPELYVLKAAKSPHKAAEEEGISISINDLRLPSTEPLIVEGAGGVMVPINDRELFVDAFKMWSLPVLLICRSELGTINHSLLSIEALRSRDISILGAVFVGPRHIDNEKAIEHYGQVPVLGQLTLTERYSTQSLISEYSTHCQDLIAALAALAS